MPEPSCLESFIALAEHVSIFSWCQTRLESTLNDVQPMGWEGVTAGGA